MRRQSEHRKIRAGYECGVTGVRCAGVRDGRTEIAVSGNAGERRLYPLEIAKHRIAESRIACAGGAALHQPTPWAGRDKIHEAIRLVHRQWTQKCLIED